MFCFAFSASSPCGLYFKYSLYSATALRYIHKLADRRHLYFFANLDPRIAESVAILRGRHNLEAWDPHTGSIGPVESKHFTRKGIDFTPRSR